MPLPKRLVEPVHVSRGTVPENFPLPSELEASTNGTLANTVRQLSSLSRHAEDLFGELARDAQQLYERSNSLQARIDRLAIKVTQLDSTVEEVSLQDIHMRKAFKSAVVFDQQIFSRDTMPTAMLETYGGCDPPPPLDKLNGYRDDGKDGLKFYTDPNYFFELWREEILKDTERAIAKKPHKPRNATQSQEVAMGGGGGRHKKRVRQPANTRERQRQIAVGHGEYIMPQQLRIVPGTAVGGVVNGAGEDVQLQRMSQGNQRPNSIEIRRSYNQQPQMEEMIDGMNHNQHSPMMINNDPDHNPYQYGSVTGNVGPLSSDSLYNQQQAGTPTRRIRPTQPPPAPPTSNPTTPLAGTPTHRITSIPTTPSTRDNLPPPPPPPDMTPPTTTSNSGLPSSPPPVSSSLPPVGGVRLLPATGGGGLRRASPPDVAAGTGGGRGSATSSPPQQQSQESDLPPPPPAPLPPPPPPPPMPVMALGGQDGMTTGPLTVIKATSPPKQLPPMIDPRNDLLKAIRDGIKLRKVEKNEQKAAEAAERGGNGLHDVASILARRVAVEFSDSETGSESECDSEGGWGENETSA